MERTVVSSAFLFQDLHFAGRTEFFAGRSPFIPSHKDHFMLRTKNLIKVTRLTCSIVSSWLKTWHISTHAKGLLPDDKRRGSFRNVILNHDVLREISIIYVTSIMPSHYVSTR